MKDRYQDFIESQQDPYEDEYDDEKDEYDEEIEDDDEEEEVEPVIKKEEPPASKPFGNGLNIQLGRPGGLGGGTNPQNNNNKKPDGKAAGYGYTPKQPFVMKPVTPAQAPAVPENPKPQGSVTPAPPVQKPIPAPAAVKETEPIDFSPVDDEEEISPRKKGLWGRKLQQRRKEDSFYEEDEEDNEPRKKGILSSFIKRHPKDTWEEEVNSREDSGEEEIQDESKKSGLLARFSLKRHKRAEEEALEQESPLQEELDTDEPSEKGKKQGFFSSVFKRHSNKTGEEAEETSRKNTQTAPENVWEEEKENVHFRRGLSGKLSSLSNRFRKRLEKKESLDEFKKEIAETDENTASGKSGKWRKAGFISGIAILFLGIAYGGGEIYLWYTHNKTNNPAQKTASTEEGAELLTDEFAKLESKTKSDLKDSESDSLFSEEGLNELDTSPSEELIEEITAAETPETDDDFLTDDLLGSSDEPEASEPQTDIYEEEFAEEIAESKPADTENNPEYSDSLDFNFDEGNAAETALAEPAETLSSGEGTSEELLVSETDPPYGQETLTQQTPSAEESSSSALNAAGLAATAVLVNNGINNLSEKTSNSLQTAETQAADTTQQVGSSLQAAGDQAVNTTQQVGSSLQAAGNQAVNTAQQVGSSLQAAGNQAVNTAQQVGSSLQESGNQGARNEPIQISIDSGGTTSSLSLAANGTNRSTGSSLGTSAVSDFAPAATQNSDFLAAPGQIGGTIGTSSLDDSANSSASGTSSAVPAPQNAAPPTEEAVAVFNAEPDLSAIGNFDALPEPSTASASASITPFGSNYTLPQETVPMLDQETIAATAAADAETQQLSTLTYNPANNESSSGYNNGKSGSANGGQTGYREYQTKAGDNLITIAEEQLGDGSRWSEISKLNPNVNLRGRLQGGLTILIPTASETSEQK